MGVFSKLKKVRASQSGNWVKPGNYVLQIQRVKVVDGQGKFFCMEFKVVSSEATEEGVTPNKPGAEVSYLENLQPPKYEDSNFGRIRAALLYAYSSLSVSGGDEPLTDDDISEDIETMANDAIDEENPLGGVFVDCFAFTSPKRNSDGNVTKLKWSVPDNLEELIKEHGEEESEAA
jgi:hypothetical protein